VVNKKRVRRGTVFSIRVACTISRRQKTVA
jgi:hypothetical protein